MEALTELCDIIAADPTQFEDKLAWICSRCPPQGSLLAPGSRPRVSLSQLHALLTVSRFLARCPAAEGDEVAAASTARSIVIEFLRAAPSIAFRSSFWPQSFSNESVSVFFSDFLRYLTAAAEISPGLSSDLVKFFGGTLISAAEAASSGSGLSRLFLVAASENCPPIQSSDAEGLLERLFEQFIGSGELEDLISSSSSENSAWSLSAQSTPSKVRIKEKDVADDGDSEATSKMNGTVASRRNSSDQLSGGNEIVGEPVVKQQVIMFEEEPIEGLEKQEIAFKIFGQVLDKGIALNSTFLEQVRKVASRQFKFLPTFLKIRKHKWREQGAQLRIRINSKLSTCKAATAVLIKSLTYLEDEGKFSKDLLRRTLALLLDAAEACVLSSWRKVKICEELFGTLLDGIARITVMRGGQLLRVLLIPLKPLVLTTCAQADTWGNSRGAMFDAITRFSCEIIEFGWSKDKALVDTFIMGLAAYLRERNDYDEEDRKEKKAISGMHLNLIRLLADLSVSSNKWEIVDMILPLFIESLEEGDALTPSPLRLQLLDAVSRVACLGFEKSYRETVVLMTRSYLDKLRTVGSAESRTLPPEATAERVETLPEGFFLVASRLKSSKLRSDYRYRLLSLCSDVGLAAESKAGRSGGDFLGPLLPAVSEICSDFQPTSEIEPSLLKLFRNLWFYIALFGLAPPIQQNQIAVKPTSTMLSSSGSVSAVVLQAVTGPYMWNERWSAAVNHIALHTPALVVSSVKWLEDELELNALHNPDSRRGSGNEKVASTQRAALSTALGGRVEGGAMNAISGVKATYLLAVSFLEIIRFSCNGGILYEESGSPTSRSAFNCVFEYLRTPNLMPAVCQCLTALVHGAFETVISWLENRMSETGNEADLRESVLSSHACFLIENSFHREEHIREISYVLLTRLKDKFPQVLWNTSCLNSLLFSVYADLPSSSLNDPTWVAAARTLYQKVVHEWIRGALSYAPCTTQGLLQVKLCKLNAWQKTQQMADVVSLLSDLRLSSLKNDCWTGIRTANIPAVVTAAAAASGADLKVTDTFSMEILPTAISSATLKSNYAGEIAGMKRLYNTIGGFQMGSSPGRPSTRAPSPSDPETDSFNQILLVKFIQYLQQFVSIADKGGSVDKAQFREICSQATALLLSNTGDDNKQNAEGFSQLLRLLCWCPAYISTAEAMETGIFIWTWLVTSAPQLGPPVLAELVDAWLWTIDTKRGLFASDVRYSGPAAKLRPHLVSGEPESLPEKDPIEGIVAHRLWLGFFIDRFEVIRYDSVEQLLLLGRMLQGTMKSPSHFSRHPAAVGTFFTVMLLGLKFCSCEIQNNLQNFRLGLHLLEDRVYHSCLGWFSNAPEWYDTNNMSFSLSEAQSVFIFASYLKEQSDTSQAELTLEGRRRETELADKCHPVWGPMDNNVIGRGKLKKLLLMLCQHEADRQEVWARPLNSKDYSSRSKISSEKWIEYVRTAFSVDPRIAISLTARFPTVTAVASEVANLVHIHILEIRTVPEALPFFVTPKAVNENSVLLQQLPHWASCSITIALEFLTPQYKAHPRVTAYVLRVLESYPPECVTFFMPQLVQALRYDDEKLVEGYLVGAAQRNDVFAHSLIWHLEGEMSGSEVGRDTVNAKSNSFQSLLPLLKQKIIDGFSPEAHDLFQREFDFFDKVTSISGVLFPLPKEDRRAGIRRELEKIEVQGEDLYLPTAPNKIVRSIQLDSGIPLQSAAKVPIMITFNVSDRDGDPNAVKPQACIFKVGDDCRQDVLALQVIALLRDIFTAVGLNLYLFPYGVLPTGPERGIIEVVPNTRSRNQMGELTDGGLYEIFQQDYGPVGSSSFEAAREMFIVSSAGYAVASLLLQPKDRHNGNLLFDNMGRLVHIDFGFILETSPGGNMRFESAQFKLSHEMTQLLDPSGSMKSETWHKFVSLCAKGYLAARRHMQAILTTVLLMVDSGLPCFSRGDPIGNLRKRFHPEMSDREAANFMIRTCADAYNKWSTAGYDLIQYLQQGIEK
ncbi:phosphatidylinositol 3- and 4-kinase family protein [Wolffia australiana]